jgi:hypothetical protein
MRRRAGLLAVLAAFGAACSDASGPIPALTAAIHLSTHDVNADGSIMVTGGGQQTQGLLTSVSVSQTLAFGDTAFLGVASFPGGVDTASVHATFFPLLGMTGYMHFSVTATAIDGSQAYAVDSALVQ